MSIVQGKAGEGMKRCWKVLVSIVLALVLVLPGCDHSSEKVLKSCSGDAVSKENEKYEDGEIEIPKVKIVSFAEEDTDGTNSFARMTVRYPKVSFSQNDTAEKAINTYFYELIQQTETCMNSFATTARQECKLRQDQSSDYDSGYYANLTVRNQGIYGRVLSFTVDTTTFSGGAHPETNRSGVSFDLEKGEILTYSDIVEDEDQFKAFAKNYLTKELETSSLYPVLFEDYQDAVSNFLCEGSFTLTKRGMDFWCNPYLAWPYSGGIHRFTIPYEQMNRYLVEKYQSN